ncbi:hypothetical protein ACQEVM_17485 [Streptomyces sp. CA-243310]|uniref:hypothetical protein n=1 Tax=Streptomyces sp. CA-243310 TaxID=3240056 RepID=UPI003D9337DF
MLAEEAVFRHARTAGRELDVRVAPDLPALVRRETSGLEVAARSGAEWTHAVRTRVACLRAVWAHDWGVLTGRPRHMITALSSACPAPTTAGITGR